LLVAQGEYGMPIFEHIVVWFASLLFSAGLLFMHLRLRSTSSLVMLLSSIFAVLWVSFGQQVFLKYQELTSPPPPVVETTAQAFARMSGGENFANIFVWVLFALLVIFTSSFFMSAYSIPRLTTQSRGPP
jgi:hypothetical protein